MCNSLFLSGTWNCMRKFNFQNKCNFKIGKQNARYLSYAWKCMVNVHNVNLIIIIIIIGVLGRINISGHFPTMPRLYWYIQLITSQISHIFSPITPGAAVWEGRVTRQRRGLNPQPLTEWLLMTTWSQTTWPPNHPTDHSWPPGHPRPPGHRTPTVNLKG